MADLHVETYGVGPRVVLVHGSGGNGTTSWSAARELADRFTLVVPTRGGYPPNAPLERIDFERQAEEIAPLLGDGAHLVGHSYGGVISLLVAAAEPECVHSLSVSEPPAFGVARTNPEVERFVAELAALFEEKSLDPAEHVRRFVRAVGVPIEVPQELPPEVEASTRAAMTERPPWEAKIPLGRLAAAPFPKLVISGAHHPAFDAVCDVLAESIGAQRLELPGRGHGIPGAPGYNEAIARFIEAA